MDKRIVVVLGCSMLLASPLFAQRWGRERTPSDGACFYEHADFDGEYFCIPAGDGVRSMPPSMNDRISSIRIFGRAEVRVFQDAYYEGRSRLFRDDVRHLRALGWNDRISSVEVRSVRHRNDWQDRRRYSDDDRSQRRGITRSEAEEIVRRAYLAVLDREPDPGSRGYVERVLRDGWTREDVERDLRKSDEYRARRRHP